MPEAPIEGAAGGQHPDHGVGLAVEQDGLIEQGRVGAEPGRPQRVRQHDDPIVPQLVFAGQNGPAVGRRNPEDIEVVRRYLPATELDRLVDAGQGDRPAALGRHVIEDLVVSLPVEEVQGRDDIAQSAGWALEHADDPVGLRVRQRGRSMPSTKLKMAVLAPMPSAKMTTATAANPGLLASVRSPNLRSCGKLKR